MKRYLLPQGGSFYKVNMHSHSRLSDGVQTPEELKEIYKAHGYSAIAYTEHDALFDLSYLSDDEFIAITSYEYAIGDKKPAFSLYEGKPRTGAHIEQMHLNLYKRDPHDKKMVCFNPKFVWGAALEHMDGLEWAGSSDYEKKFTVECFNEIIREANANGFLVCYNHPNWSLNTYETYSRLEGLAFFELCNGASNLGSDMDYTPHVYDQMLRSGQTPIPVGGDDNHNIQHFFQAWTMVKADSLTYENLINGLEVGNCYVSSGPEIHDLYVEDGSVTVKCSEATNVYYYTAGRRRARKTVGANGLPVTEATFKIDPEDIYFRISIKDKDGNHANTRAYFLNEV